MNRREKILGGLVLGIILLFAAVFGLKAVFTKPLHELDEKTAALREKLAKINKERHTSFAAEDRVKTFAQHTFADQVDEASAKSGELLTKQILLSGLREADFSRLPIGPRKRYGASEIGWSVQGHGELSDVLDLLFLLEASPYLHRIENITLSAGEAPGFVRVGFRFLTLVIRAAPEVDPISLETKLTPDSPERRAFDGIVVRDLLRPYVKRAPGDPHSPPPTPAPPGPESFRVVSLSEWMGQPEVHVRDLSAQSTARYKPGDELAGGVIVMIDYRPLPMPGNESLLSFSRVILKINSEYWAIERGQTLADKHLLPPERLPEQLCKP